MQASRRRQHRLLQAQRAGCNCYDFEAHEGEMGPDPALQILGVRKPCCETSTRNTYGESREPLAGPPLVGNLLPQHTSESKWLARTTTKRPNPPVSLGSSHRNSIPRSHEPLMLETRPGGNALGIGSSRRPSRLASLGKSKASVASLQQMGRFQERLVRHAIVQLFRIGCLLC